MKQGWTEVALGEVGEVVGGGTPRTSVAAYWGGEIPWATPKDLSDQGSRYIRKTARSITERGLRGSAARVLPSGSVLLSSRAPIGLVAINSVPMATSQGFKSILPDRTRLDPAYLAYWLETNTAYLQSLGSGATFREISKRVVEQVRIPLPPLDEQRWVVRILDTADELRSRRQQTLQLLATLRRAMFTVCPPGKCRRMSLGDLLDRIDSGKSPVCASQPAADGQWGVLKLGAVSFGEYRPWENKAMLAASEIDPSLEVAPGDVLLARKNTIDLVGASAYVRDTPPRLLLPDLIFRLVVRVSAPIRPVFLQATLAQPQSRAAIARLAGGSAGSMPNVSKKRLLTVEVDVPPLEEQLRYERRSAALDSLVQRLSAQLHQLHELFASLQRRAFNGDL